MTDREEIARRGRELFERGQAHLAAVTRTGWATDDVAADARREVEIEARAALIVVLAAARGLDQLYLGREEPPPLEEYAKQRTDLLTAVVYAADKSLHLKLGIAEIVETAPAPGPHAYGRSAYGGRSSFEPVLRWPSSVPDRPGRQLEPRDALKRAAYEALLQDQPVCPTLSEVAAWFARWWSPLPP